jgi:CubicO group peptidase (beta-lactamase class C family)
MILAEEKKLELTDPVSKYLKVPDSWKGITIHHLLSHTSGLGDYPDSFSLQKDYTEEELMAMITAQPLQFQPGENWSYSNLAYVTLGILIRKISGKFYGDFLEERVFAPAGMKTAQVINEADIIPNRAAGYVRRNGELKNQEWVSPVLNTTADGSLYFTIEDLAKWDAALNGEKILSRSSLEKMWTPVRLNDGTSKPYGYGWGVEKTPSGKKIIEHGGAWQGFTSHIARYPEHNITVAALCNVAACDTSYIAHKAAGFYVAELGPAAYKAIQLPDQTLKSYEGEYRLEDRLSLKITAANNRLETTFQGETIHLIPFEETKFFVEDREWTMEFVRGDDGKITKMIVRLPTELTFVRQ